MDSNGQVDVLLKVGDRYENGKHQYGHCPELESLLVW